MSDPMEDVQVNFHPQRRRQTVESNKTDTSPYFTPSKTKEAEKSESPEEARPRQRQGVLDFSGGRLTTKKPLINPVGRGDARRKALAEVAEETLTLLPGLLATRPDVSNASFLCRKETLDPARCPSLPPTKVRVIDADTIDAALILQTGSQRPVAVLNMANAKHAGGGWKHGALAQEEALCYRTSLSKTLHYKHYPIPDDAALYSPRVLIIRDSMSNGHDLLDFRVPSQLDVISVISCAAVCQPSLRKDAQGLQTYRDQKDVKLMKEKMRIVLRTSIRNKHRQIVLGAFGCGAFGNPNHVVASMWHDVLHETEFQGGYWKDLVFAVLDGKLIGSNFQVFHKALDGILV